MMPINPNHYHASGVIEIRTYARAELGKKSAFQVCSTYTKSTYSFSQPIFTKGIDFLSVTKLKEQTIFVAEFSEIIDSTSLESALTVNIFDKESGAEGSIDKILGVKHL